MFLRACKHDQELYETRSSRLKTPEAGFHWNLQHVRGGWRVYFMNVGRCSVLDREGCMKIMCHDDGPRGSRQSSQLMEAVLRLCKERGHRVLADAFAHPNCTVTCISGDAEEEAAARREMLIDFHVLLKAERLGHAQPLCASILRLTPWPKWQIR